MLDADVPHAGERSFRDFFRLPPTKENRRQSVDPACRLCGGSFMNVGCTHTFVIYSAQAFRCFGPGAESEKDTVIVPGLSHFARGMR